MRILVAEKDPAVRSLIITRLVHRHYEVIECSQSEDVLRALERERADLILISTQMERVGGKLLIERIRERSHLASVSVIVMAEEDQLAELLMIKERGFDDFLIKPFSPLDLQLRVALNIARNHEKIRTNALTHLPGNHTIEKIIRKKIEEGEKFSVLYVDINHFKSFNDLYGFEKGDNVIRQTANILLQTAEKVLPNEDCFVGHIGGDDFIVVLGVEHEEAFARTFIAEFDRIIPTYYNEAHQKQGYVRVTNRRGKRETVPLMSCSVAACNNVRRPYKNLGEIAQDAAEVKNFLKMQPGSHYLRDRRHEPLDRLEKAAELLVQDAKNKKEPSRIDPLGQALMNAGLINQEALDAALKRHLETGKRLGQTLIDMNLIHSDDVGAMLEKKLGVPYVSLMKTAISREMIRLFTLEFMKSHRVVPLEITQQGLRLALCDPFDLRTLDAIENITGLKPVPCLALEDEFEEFIERHTGDVVLEEKIG
ncbi:MAG: diguanylate cyclase [Candidatus Omnitrophica bacterium]|nr:diguanylate cyclase [Candidatus Omnitrophota bacterium]